MRQRKFSIFAILLLCLLLMGCASPQRRMAQGQRLQNQGNHAHALVIYEATLARIPLSDRKLRAQLLLRIGDCQAALDRLSEAFQSYDKAAEIDPANPLVHVRLGELYLVGGAADRAREHAHIALAGGGSSSEAQALMGAAWAATGENELARDSYTRALALDPKRVPVALALADVYNRLDQINYARKVLEDAITAQPNSALPWMALGRLDEQRGESAQAERNYRRAVAIEDTPETNLRLAQFLQRAARIPEAEQVLRRVDAQRSTMPTALPDSQMLSGRVNAALDNYEEALKARSAGAAHQNREPRRVVDLAQGQLAARLIEAEIQAAQQQAEVKRKDDLMRAREHLDRYRSWLDAATVAILEAEISLADSDLVMARLRANSAVSLAPQSAAAHYVLGTVLLREGDGAGARRELLAAYDADSHFIAARLELTALALRNGDLAAAEQFIVPAVRDEPANLRALVLFARVLAAQGRRNSAAMVARRALAVDSGAGDPHLILGSLALREHRPLDALVQFEQAMVLEPESREALNGLLAVYRRGRITRPMLAHMEQVAASKPQSATLMEITGRLYAEHGWSRDSRRCLERALKMEPQRTTAANALAQVQAAAGEVERAAASAELMGGNSASLLAGLRAEQQNNLTAAVNLYEAAVRQGDRSGVAANNLAWLYAQAGRNLDRALKLAKTARDADPRNPAVLDTMGFVYLARREYSDAIRTLEAARRVAAGELGRAEPDHKLQSIIRGHLAEAYLRAGQPDQAALIARNREPLR